MKHYLTPYEARVFGKHLVQGSFVIVRPIPSKPRPITRARPVPWERTYTNEPNRETLIPGLRKKDVRTEAVGFLHDFTEKDSYEDE